MNLHPSIVVFLLYETGKISLDEATLLEEGLKGKEIPQSWLEVKNQIEMVLGRILEEDLL